ncbi:MAG: alpha/beta fold hydrolase [Spirochaetota bacterium]
MELLGRSPIIESLQGAGIAGKCVGVHFLCLRDRAATFSTPTLVIWGSRDPLISREQAERTAEALGAQLEVIEHVGHALMIEDPALFTELVSEFDASETSESTTHAGSRARR